jgi:hypothetical protein
MAFKKSNTSILKTEGIKTCFLWISVTWSYRDPDRDPVCAQQYSIHFVTLVVLVLSRYKYTSRCIVKEMYLEKLKRQVL